MVYFQEKNNKFYANVKGSTISSSTFTRGLPIIVTLIIIGVFIYQKMQSNMSLSNLFPLAGTISIFIFANLIAHILRSKALGSGIIIDQMERTISLRRPGGRKNTINYDTVRRIKLETKGNTMAIIKLETLDSQDIFLLALRDVLTARQVADELSTLISATVSETGLA